jgi:hypothetical protein
MKDTLKILLVTLCTAGLLGMWGSLTADDNDDNAQQVKMQQSP